ncbi:hypothetical protein [Pandoraea sp. NPDC087047]|uniref:hypothetical protein n=1 Tax=Pandoraea sp. NPDC087047 TaxID=3364390 RepID=UPI003817EF58
MTSDDVSARRAAFAVGYESVQQFTREHRRMFGLPSGKDTETAIGELRHRYAGLYYAPGSPGVTFCQDGIRPTFP